MQCRQHVGQPDQTLEVRNRPVAPPAPEVAHERRAVYRGKDLVATADPDGPHGIAGDLFEFRWRRAAERAHQITRRSDASASDVRAGDPPGLQRLVVAAKFEPDFLDQPVGLRLEADEAFLVNHLDKGDRPLNVRRGW